jgi:hypothetical protein
MKNGVVVCLNANKPGVCAATQLAYEVWLKKTKARHENKKRNHGVNFDKLSDANKAKMKEAVLASMKMDAHTSNGTTMASPRKKPMILVANVIILSLASGSRDILPAPIMSNFPHIHLQLSTNLGCPNCPVVHCIVNTAAALSTENFHFIAAVAKQYPHCVAKLYVPKDYNPIMLSGIVQRGGESVTTKLTVGFQFHLPYLTKDGNPTSILIATGPHVMVNLIVGLPFIQATCAIIDLADNVVDLRTLDAPPVPLEYRCAMVQVPVMGEGGKHPVHMAGAYDNLLSEIKSLKQYFTQALTITAPEIEDGLGQRKDSFGASPAKATYIPPTTLQLALAHATNVGKRGFVADPIEIYSEPNMGISSDD